MAGISRNHSALAIVTILAVTAGIYFRVMHLDRRLFWFDECYTALKLSGHRDYVAQAAFLDGTSKSIAEARQYQRLDPQRGWLETLKRCAGSDPQVAPLHCAVLRIWAMIFGDSVAALRAFSVLIGLLCLPAVAWLAYEVMAGRTAPLVAATLMALRPFDVVFSQEAREYALWTLMVILTSAALLRALRTGRRGIWIAYAALTAVALYSHLLHLIVLLVHGLVVLLAREKSQSSFKRFALFAGAGVAALAPWLAVLAVQATVAREKIAWIGSDVGVGTYLRRIVRHAGLVAIDFGSNTASSPQLAAQALVLLCLMAALYLVWRRARPGAGRHLALLLALVPAAVLGGTDLVLGGQRMAVGRYLVPSVVGFGLVLTCAISWMLESELRRQRIIGWFALGTILTTGLLSCRLFINSEAWWNKGASRRNIPCAAVIRMTTHPLLIVEPPGENFGDVLSLSHVVDDRLQVVGDPAAGFDFGRFDRLIVYNPSQPYLEQLQARTGMTATPLANTPPESNLYELLPRP